MLAHHTRSNAQLAERGVSQHPRGLVVDVSAQAQWRIGVIVLSSDEPVEQSRLRPVPEIFGVLNL